MSKATSSFIFEQRKAEIMKELPKLSMNELMAKKSELLVRVNELKKQRNHADADELRKIRSEVFKEIDSRQQADAIANKTDGDSINKKVLVESKSKRRLSMIATAQKKIDKEVAAYNNAPFSRREQMKNPADDKAEERAFEIFGEVFTRTDTEV